ncbi:MAG: hypothetical protein UW78_C0001G0050 [Candidatus Azambacteria bacterium GW2011_GWA1_44_9]|uniref:Uncharacterized protein n=2 Tax=Parcubacteria group TaxID=1794811 RepID=A0A0G1MN89_9BACT|nr:MAG: hypothetical protein UW78_C0001G0050 [Candidatus Azambacteria bacterium GW2011_GWA1_44_9]
MQDYNFKQEVAMSIKLVFLNLLGVDLTLPDGREAMVFRLLSDTEISLLYEAESNDFRIAKKEELKAFAQKYSPSRWHSRAVGIGPVFFAKACALAKIYRINGSWVEEAKEDVVWTLPRGTEVLFVRER